MMIYLVTFCAVIYGAILASFVTLVGYRVPLKMSIVHPPSHCSSCKRTLTPMDLIPVISYVLNRGKCRGCGVAYGSFHVWMEVLNAFMFGVVAYAFYGDWIVMIGLFAYLLYVNVMIVALRVHGVGINKLSIVTAVVLIGLSFVHMYFLLSLAFVVVGLLLYPRAKVLYFMQYISIGVLLMYSISQVA